MVVADAGADVDDVAGDLVEGGILEVVNWECGVWIVPRRDAGDEVGREIDHDQAVGLAGEVEHVVVYVSGVRAESIGGGVGIDDGCARSVV